MRNFTRYIIDKNGYYYITNKDRSKVRKAAWTRDVSDATLFKNTRHLNSCIKQAKMERGEIQIREVLLTVK